MPMYEPILWKDHVTQYPDRRRITDNGDGTQTVTKEQGEVIQQGTPQSATYFGAMDFGILDAHTAMELLLLLTRQTEWRVSDLEVATAQEVGTVTLTNTERYPFNNSQQTVALTNRRENTNYVIEILSVAGTGGCVGDIVCTDRLVNGFKIAHTGSAKSVTINYAVIGGYEK